VNRDAIDAAFEGLGETYPGSRQKRRTVAAPAPVAEEDEDRWDAHPVFIDVDGKPVEFFKIGALAAALHRKPVTMRKWIETGVIPKERYRSSGVGKQGSRRLWTRLQIEGIVRIAREEGLFSGRSVGSTEFTVRVQELFRHLKAVEP
jgi:hypothetical protein